MGKRAGFRCGARPAIGLALIIIIAATAPVRAQSDRTARKSRRARASSARSEEPPPARPDGLRMSRAVVCRTIDGYENYKPLPNAAQTSEEKLLVYYRPLRYKTEFTDGYYRAHIIQDNEIRKRGERKILREKRKTIDYEPKSQEGLNQLFMKSMISLKGLPPGEYELTIILHDELDKAAPASRQVVMFKIIPPDDPRTKKAGEKAEGPPPE